ncbi:MAG: DM13 domain-containing protein, partial [Myxococcales bacterium]|nr:DM13 domain-containing protein [Myxococcales bacterium]
LGTLVAAAATACTSDETAQPLVGSSNVPPTGGGKTVYENRVTGANTFTCATCHALSEPASDGLRRPGHAIGDATRRPTWKNGKVPRMLDAVNSCLTEWMNAEPWTETDARYTALHGWLDGTATAMGAPAVAPAVKIQRVDPPAMVSGGDAQRGIATFNHSCVVCHGMNGEGTERAPNVRGLGLVPGYIAERVRRSGRADSEVYPGLTGGVMPFWGADRLSDMELVDIVAFLAMKDGAAPPPAAPGGTFDLTTRSCAKTHARVGQTAVLETHIHGTSGKATIIDDCTVEISEFTYDGGGIFVQVFGAIDRDYQRGFAMTSKDLRKPGGYSNAVLRVNLPADRTLNDLDSIAVWCVPAGANFADGLLE